MHCKRLFAHLLLALQVLQLFAASSTSAIADPVELVNFDIPSSEMFKSIQQQWIQVDLNESQTNPITKQSKVRESHQNNDLYDKNRNNSLKNSVAEFFTGNLTESVKKLEKLAEEKPKKKKESMTLRNAILDFFIKTSPNCHITTKFTKPRDWEDLQLFSGKTTLVESISRTLLRAGNVYTGALLAQRPPIEATLQRRDLIASLIDKKDLADQLKTTIQKFAEYEEVFFSNTIQPEDPAVRIAIEDIQPGWLLQKLPKQFFSENPHFLRFHAALTQKTAPFFWTPLMTLKETGSSFFPALPYSLIGIFLWRLNGIPQTITKDFIAYTAYRAKKDPNFHYSKSSKSDLIWKSIKFAFFNTPSYLKNQLFPSGARLKTIAGIANDTFLWNTTELRLALNKKHVRATTQTAEKPEPLGTGPYYSLWMNGQHNNHIYWNIIHDLAATCHKSYFGQPIPKQTSVNPTWMHKFATILKGQRDLWKNESGAIGKAAKFTYTLSTLSEIARDPATAIHSTTAATASAFSRIVTSPIMAIRARGARILGHEAPPAQTPTEASTSGAFQRLSENCIHLFGEYANTASISPKKTLTSHSADLLYWIIISYLYRAWLTRNDEQKARINVLDKIMFTAAKPAMLLLSAVSNIQEILSTHKEHLPVPKSLRTKIDKYIHLTSTINTEVTALAKSRTFERDTGHKLLDHTGEVRRAYTLLQKQPTHELLKLALHIIAELDSYMGIATLAKEYAEGDNRLCPVNFIKAPEPFINAKNAWFALLGKNAIGSDLLMGNGNATNMLLTGMNGGGKSIMLKTCVFTILLAHIFGYTTAQQCSMTPFSELNLHLSSLDNAAEGKSRWVAEAEAIVSMINSAEALHSPDYFMLILGDELGDGTAPDASIRVMIKLLSTISEKTHVLSFISSHLQPLTELEKTLPRIRNYRINPARKLEPGINETNIALAIFEKFSNTKKGSNAFAEALAIQTTPPNITMVA